MNCDCKKEINEKLKDQNAELDGRLFAYSVEGGKMFRCMFLPLVNPDTGRKAKAGPVRINFCPFCGKDARPATEENNLHEPSSTAS